MFENKILYFDIVNENPVFIFNHKGYYFYIVVGKEGFDSFSKPTSNLDLIKARFELKDISELDEKFADRMEIAEKQFEKKLDIIEERIELSNQEKLSKIALN